MNSSPPLPNLEERFLEPEGWQWGELVSNTGKAERRIRYGCSFPEDGPPKAIVVCLNGLSEFAEKYFEVARDVNKQGFAFWTLDWAGQGRSSRYLSNPHKRHSGGFQNDIDDLHALIEDHIKPTVNMEHVPLAMLGHSMGGNIGLHYLHQHPGIFDCAAFSAPMWGLKVFQSTPNGLAALLTRLFKTFLPKTYAYGAGDWSEAPRLTPGDDKFSHDPIRGHVHNAWCLADTRLQVGHITYTWVYEAYKHCLKIDDAILRSIQTPVIVGLAHDEDFVSNRKIRQIVYALAFANLLEFPNSRHEILMERDAVRQVFLDTFYTLIQETITDTPEGLKPF